MFPPEIEHRHRHRHRHGHRQGNRQDIHLELSTDIGSGPAGHSAAATSDPGVLTKVKLNLMMMI